jgi:hypothetical protein
MFHSIKVHYFNTRVATFIQHTFKVGTPTKIPEGTQVKVNLTLKTLGDY